MERDFDVLGNYRNISNKLKKKFLRKPNVAEGSEQYGSLARTLKDQECPQYAAFCFLAQARCEHTLGNSVGETQALVDAARGFMQAHMSDVELHCPNFQEHMNAAINSYSHAIRVYVESKHPALAASLCLELGNHLRTLKRSSEALAHFHRAAQLQAFNILDWLQAMKLAASCQIDTVDHEGALSTFTEMSRLIKDKHMLTGGTRPTGAFCDKYANCEINRVLLLLLLQPHPQILHSDHAKLLESFTWDSDQEISPNNYLQEDLFLLLQSTVLGCQSKDMDSLTEMELELWPWFDVEQRHLMHLVIENVQKSIGDCLD